MRLTASGVCHHLLQFLSRLHTFVLGSSVRGRQKQERRDNKAAFRGFSSGYARNENSCCENKLIKCFGTAYLELIQCFGTGWRVAQLRVSIKVNDGLHHIVWENISQYYAVLFSMPMPVKLMLVLPTRTRRFVFEFPKP